MVRTQLSQKQVGIVIQARASLLGLPAATVSKVAYHTGYLYLSRHCEVVRDGHGWHLFEAVPA